MDKKKREALEAQGIRVTDSPAEMLGLSQERMNMIDLKMKLGALVKKLRLEKLQHEKKWTQSHLGKLMGTQQPAIALLERGSPKVALERFILAVGILGATLDVQVEGESLLKAAG